MRDRIRNIAADFYREIGQEFFLGENARAADANAIIARETVSGDLARVVEAPCEGDRNKSRGVLAPEGDASDPFCFFEHLASVLQTSTFVDRFPKKFLEIFWGPTSVGCPEIHSGQPRRDFRSRGNRSEAPPRPGAWRHAARRSRVHDKLIIGHFRVIH